MLIVYNFQLNSVRNSASFETIFFFCYCAGSTMASSTAAGSSLAPLSCWQCLPSWLWRLGRSPHSRAQPACWQSSPCRCGSVNSVDGVEVWGGVAGGPRFRLSSSWCSDGSDFPTCVKLLCPYLSCSLPCTRSQRLCAQPREFAPATPSPPMRMFPINISPAPCPPPPCPSRPALAASAGVPHCPHPRTQCRRH